MGDGGYSPSGKGLDNKLFILFPVSPDGVLFDGVLYCTEGVLTISGLHKPWRWMLKYRDHSEPGFDA
jgi:hypothetical protein